MDSTSAAGTYQNCSSPAQYTNLISGEVYTFYVQATDLAGNTSAIPASIEWSQENSNTAALFHFDAGEELFDSGISGVDLDDFGTTADANGVFGQARLFDMTTSSSMTWSDNPMHDGLTSSMTIELWIKPTVFSNGQSMGLVSKMGGAGNNSFELSIHRQGGSKNARLSVNLTSDGTTMTVLESSNLHIGTDVLENGWNHVAFVYDMGSVLLFLNGTVVGTHTFGTLGSTVLFDSTANIDIGLSSAGDYFDGSMDEIRISQTARYTGTFTVPASPFVMD